MQDNIFRDCSSGVCFARLNPVRLGNGGNEDILENGLSFFCPLTNATDISRTLFERCEVHPKNSDRTGFINLEDENYIFSCRSVESQMRADRTYRQEDKYNCTRLVERQASPVNTPPQITTQVNTPPQITTQVTPPQITTQVTPPQAQQTDPFANTIPDIVSNREQIAQNRSQIDKNSLMLSEISRQQKVAPLPRFGFARME